MGTPYLIINHLITKGLSLKLRRDCTWQYTGADNFKIKKMSVDETEAATEIIPLSLHPFVEIQDKIHKMTDSGISSADSRADYEKAANITINHGVQTYFILFKEKGQAFQLEEVYCDGDLLYRKDIYPKKG